MSSSASLRAELRVLAPACVLALACSLVPFAGALPADRQLAGRDLFVLFYPLQQRVAARQAAGELLPGRDPARGAGAALLADPLAQVAYPGSWLRAAVPFPVGFKAWLILHVALAGVGAAALARALGAGSRGCALAAATAALAGPVAAIARHPNLLAATAWLGFALAGLVLLARRPRAGGALLAAALALMLLAGGGELVLLVGLGAGVWLLAQPCERRERLGLAGLAVGAALLSGLLAAVHLLPALSWLAETERAAGVGAAEAVRWSLHPVRLLELVTPGLNPDTHAGLRDLLARAGRPFGAPFHAGVHLGAVAVALAGLAAWRRPRARGLLIAGAVWLALALGAWTPAFGLARSLPGFDAWRYPAKALLPLAILVPALAGVGLRELPRRARAAAASLAIGLSLVAVWTTPSLAPTLPQAFFDQPPILAGESWAHLAGVDPPGRFLRIRGGAPPTGAGFEAQRAAQRAGLVADLPSLYGLRDLSAYGPLRNRRIREYLSSIRAGGTLDYRRLAEDARVGAVLDGALHLRATPPAVQLTDGARGRWTLVRHLPERLEVDLDLRQAGRVYLSEAWDPAWRADLDGRPVAVEPARILFCAVAVPAGRSRLTLRYDPPGLGWGLLLSALGLGLWVWLLVSASGRASSSRPGSTAPSA